MPTSLPTARCPGCGKPVFKVTMRPFQGIFYCVECFIPATLKQRGRSTGQPERQRQRMRMKEAKMPIKYGTAEHVEVTGNSAVITNKKLKSGEAEKIASKKPDPKKSASQAVVTNKDFKRTDEDYIPGD